MVYRVHGPADKAKFVEHIVVLDDDERVNERIPDSGKVPSHTTLRTKGGGLYRIYVSRAVPDVVLLATVRIDRRMILGLLVAVVLLGVFLSGVDGPALLAALRTVNVGWLLVGSVLILVEWVARGVRWWVLLRAVDDEGPSAMISATLAGAAANTLVPLRGGDILRPVMLSIRRHIPLAAAISSTVIDRLFDLGGVLLLLLALDFTLPVQAETSAAMENLRLAVHGAVGGGLLLVLLLVVSVSAPARELAVLGLSRLPSERLSARAVEVFDQIVAGVVVAGKPSRLVVAALLTALVWLCAVGAAEATQRSIGLDLPISAAILVVVTVNLAVSIPQGPGFVGVFQVAVEQALSLFAAPKGASQAVAILFWAVSFVPVTAIGAFEAWRQGVNLRGAEGP